MVKIPGEPTTPVERLEGPSGVELTPQEFKREVKMAEQQVEIMNVKPVTDEEFTRSDADIQRENKLLEHRKNHEGEQEKKEKLDKIEFKLNGGMRTEEEPARNWVDREPQSEDITDILSTFRDFPVEEAVEDITGADNYGITPASYNQLKPYIKKQTELDAYPKKIHRSIASVAAKSEQHGAIVKKDLSTWEAVQQHINFTSDHIKGRGISRKVFKLMQKKASGTLTNEEAYDLNKLNDELEEHNRITGSYGFGFFKSLPGETVSGLVDIGRSIWESKEEAGAGAAAGGAAGAAVGLIGGPAGAAIGAKIGATKGFALGMSAGMLIDGYEQSVGEVYHELYYKTVENYQGEERKKVDEEMKAISKGAGVFMSLLELPVISAYKKNVPWLKKLLSPRAAIKHIMSMPGAKGQAYRSFLKSVGSQMATEGIVESVQEIIGIFSKELGQSWNGDETNFVKALEEVNKKKGQYAEQVGKAGVVGGAVGGSTVAVGRAVTPVVEKVAGLKNKPKVEAKPEVVGPQPFMGPPAPKTDVVGKNITNDVKGTQAIQLQQLIQHVSNETKNTELAKNLPLELEQVRQEMFNDNGIDGVWVDKEDLNEFANNEEKARIVRDIIDDTGVAASEINAPIRVNMAQWLKIVDQYPEAAEIIKTEPEGPTAKKWKLELENRAEQRRKLVLMVDEKAQEQELERLKNDAEKMRAEREKSATEFNRQKMEIEKLKDKFPEEYLKRKEAFKPTEEEFSAKLAEEAKTYQKIQDTQQELLKSMLPKEYTIVRDDKSSVGKFKVVKVGEESGQNYGYGETEGDAVLRFRKLRDETRQKPKVIEGEKQEFPSPSPELEYNPKNRFKDSDIFDEDSYLEQQTFTPEMESVLGKNEIKKLNEAQINTRLEVIEAINAEQEKQMDKINDLEALMAIQLEEEFQTEQAQSNPKIQIVESFLKPQEGKDVPAFQINPDSLTESQKKMYLSNPNLKRTQTLKARKVFREPGEGIRLDQAAAIFGIDPDEFLKILATTPTIEEAVEQNMQKREMEIIEETVSNQSFDESRLARAYNDMSRIHLKELKILKNKYWAGMKTGIKAVVKPIPTIQSLRNKARDFVGSLKVKDINVNQWKVAERRSQRKAVNHILKNEVEAAFTEKENAVYATEVTRASHIATGRVNKAFKFISSLAGERIQAELQSAGKIYTDAVNAIMGLYNFDPRQRNQDNVDKYNKFVEHMVEKGQGDFSIPPEVQQWLTPQISAKELTVDQVYEIEKILRRVLKQARLKNKLSVDGEAETVVDVIAAELAEVAKNDPRLDERRADEPNRSLSIGERMSRLMGVLEAYVMNIKAITDKLGNYKQGVANIWETMIWAPLEGTGAYRGIYGMIAKARLQAETKKKIEGYIKEYGKTEFTQNRIKSVYVREFRDIPALHYGKMIKTDLIQILLNMGNASNKKIVENFGIDAESMMKILERELTEKDFQFAQNIWNLLRGLGPKVQSTYKILTDSELEFLTPEPFEAHGRVWDGGYFPAKLKRDTGQFLEALNQTLTSMTSNVKKAPIMPHPAFEGMVRDPMTKQRKPHEYVLDLELDNIAIAIDEITHYVTMAVPVKDVMNILSHKDVADSIKGLIGISQYTTLFNSVGALTNSIPASNTILHGKLTRWAGKFLSNLEGKFIVTLLAGSPSTMEMQVLPFNEVTRRLGPKGFGYLQDAIRTLSNPLNWNKMKEIYTFIGEREPTLFRHREGLDDHSPAGLSQVIPVERAIKSKSWQWLREGQDWMNQKLMNDVFGTVDGFIKASGYIAAYRQFLAGDADGYPAGYLNGLTDEQKENQATQYASSVIASSTMRATPLDKAPIQNMPMLKHFARLFNEIRNVLNNTIGDVRKGHLNAKEMIKLYNEENYLDAHVKFHDLGYRAALFLFIPIWTQFISAISQGKNPAPPEDGGEEELKDFQMANLPDWILSRFTTYEGAKDMLFTTFGDNIPIVRNLIWAGKTGKPTSIPLLAAGDHFKTTVTEFSGMYLRSVNDEISLIEAWAELPPQKRKSFYFSAGILAGGLPVNAMLKLDKMMTDEDGESTLGAAPEVTVGVTLGLLDRLIKLLGGSDDKYEGMTEEEIKYEKAKEELENEFSAVVDKAKALQAQLEPVKQSDNDDILDDEEYQIIKYAESNGRTNARSASNAYGPYQFIESTWRRVINTPDGKRARLTMSDRYNAKKQEVAMRILTRENGRALQAMNVPLNIETIYFAHHFGPDRAKDIYKNQSDKTKLSKNFFGQSEIKNNFKTKGKPNRPDQPKTVGEMREYIVNALKRGEENYNKSK